MDGNLLKARLENFSPAKEIHAKLFKPIKINISSRFNQCAFHPKSVFDIKKLEL
jgi:hypothetical protein